MDNEQNLDVKPQSGEMDDSSTSTETSEQDANAGQSMQDFVKDSMNRAADKSKSGEAESANVEAEEESSSVTEKDAEQAEETSAEKTGEQEEQEEKPGDQKEEVTSEDEKVENETKPVPYERFREVNERATQAEETLKSVENEVKNYRNIVSICERNRISAQQFNETLDLLVALNNGDVEKVAPKIREWYTQVQTIEGEKLPPDIQAKVDQGLDLDTAKAWAKDRARAKIVETRGRKTVEQIQQEQQAEFERQSDMAIEQWVQSKMTADPDFKKGSLKWEEVDDRHMALLNARDQQGNFVNLVKSANDAIKLLDRAYTDVSTRMKKRNGDKPSTKKRLPTNGSSTISTKRPFEQAKTLSEAVAIGMKERGHTFS